uniref:Squalene monooxygenase 2 n=1 Tax=Anthurium amnicola TaxID=1678845 RepID=A0A1D1Z8Y9_9ARAE
METKVVVVCTVVGFLGVSSAALGFAAEAKRIKNSDVQTTPGKCIYPKSPSLGLGLAAALALMMAQAIINAVAGCICCKKHPNSSGTNWTIGLISFIISWITFIIAFLLLLGGAALNDLHGEERMNFRGYCYVVRPGVFSGGALLALASVSLGIIYYVIRSSSKPLESWGAQQSQEVALGHPQIPQQSSQPVFVHEDTYNRRQFP